MNPNVESAPSFLACVRADLDRHYEGFSVVLLLRAILFKRTFSPVFALRLCQAARSSRWAVLLLPPARMFHRWATGRAAVDLPWQTSIGPGFRIVHGFGLVINQRAKIGSNVTIFHGVTIGQRDRIFGSSREVRYPSIGDGVFLGAYSMVLGVDVGANSSVAPLSVLIEPVPAGVVVGGNPARILKRKDQADIADQPRPTDAPPVISHWITALADQETGEAGIPQ